MDEKEFYCLYGDDILHGEMEEDRPAWCLCSRRLPHPPRCEENRKKLEEKP